MSLATMNRPAIARRNRTRKPATLTLDVNGTPYDVRCFDVDDSVCGDGLSLTGMEHKLTGPDGVSFQVYGLDSRRAFCQRCDREGCSHVLALSDVGLLG